jgi:hypothetical protein
MSHNTEDMTKEKWLADCAARFKQRVPDANDEFCNEQAEICFESIGGDLTEIPADCADEELSNWTE